MRIPTMQQLDDERFAGSAMSMSIDELKDGITRMNRAIEIFRKDNAGYKRKLKMLTRELKTRN